MPLIFKFLKKWIKIIWTIFKKTGTFSENSEQKFESRNIFWIYEQICEMGTFFEFLNKIWKTGKKIEIRIFLKINLKRKKGKEKRNRKKETEKNDIEATTNQTWVRPTEVSGATLFQRCYRYLPPTGGTYDWPSWVVRNRLSNYARSKWRALLHPAAWSTLLTRWIYHLFVFYFYLSIFSYFHSWTFKKYLEDFLELENTF